MEENKKVSTGEKIKTKFVEIEKKVEEKVAIATEKVSEKTEKLKNDIKESSLYKKMGEKNSKK